MKTIVLQEQASHRAEVEQVSLMNPLTISISLPQNLQVDEQTARELLVLALVEGGRLSQSQGAQVLGISRYDLIDLTSKYDIPVARLSQQDMEQEQTSLRELQNRRDQIS